MPISPNLDDQAVPLSEVIAAVAERIHYAEGRRTNFSVVAGALLAGGVAILTFIPDKHLSHSLADAAFCASIGAILLGLLLLIVFARQTNRYPWTAATNTWKWFYRDALPDQAEFDWTWRDVLNPRVEKKRLQAAFGRQLPQFEANIQKLRDPKISIDQDIQQLYVLHINDKFKNAHLSQLRTILFRGLFIVAFISGIGAWIGHCEDHRRTAPHIKEMRVGAIELSTRWRFVTSTDESGLVLATVKIINRGSKAVELPRWNFIDAQGAPVPASISMPPGSANEIPAHTKARYSVFIKPLEPTKVESLVVRIQ